MLERVGVGGGGGGVEGARMAQNRNAQFLASGKKAVAINIIWPPPDRTALDSQQRGPWPLCLQPTRVWHREGGGEGWMEGTRKSSRWGWRSAADWQHPTKNPPPHNTGGGADQLSTMGGWGCNEPARWVLKEWNTDCRGWGGKMGGVGVGGEKRVWFGSPDTTGWCTGHRAPLDCHFHLLCCQPLYGTPLWMLLHVCVCLCVSEWLLRVGDLTAQLVQHYVNQLHAYLQVKHCWYHTEVWYCWYLDLGEEIGHTWLLLSLLTVQW